MSCLGQLSLAKPMLFAMASDHGTDAGGKTAKFFLYGSLMTFPESYSYEFDSEWSAASAATASYCYKLIEGAVRTDCRLPETRDRFSDRHNSPFGVRGCVVVISQLARN